MSTQVASKIMIGKSKLLYKIFISSVMEMVLGKNNSVNESSRMHLVLLTTLVGIKILLSNQFSELLYPNVQEILLW